MEPKFSHWMKHVRDTQDEEIDCSACLDQISQFVDLELATGEAAQSMPQVDHHLDQCEVCNEEYHILRELALLESDEELPTHEALVERLRNRTDQG